MVNTSVLGSVQFRPVNVSATCASRPCFPGVQCINLRPPHVGYVCGRCPPGLYGNGRVCSKNAKAGMILYRYQPTFVNVVFCATTSLGIVKNNTLLAFTLHSLFPQHSITSHSSTQMARIANSHMEGAAKYPRSTCPYCPTDTVLNICRRCQS